MARGDFLGLQPPLRRIVGRQKGNARFVHDAGVLGVRAVRVGVAADNEPAKAGLGGNALEFGHLAREPNGGVSARIGTGIGKRVTAPGQLRFDCTRDWAIETTDCNRHRLTFLRFRARKYRTSDGARDRHPVFPPACRQTTRASKECRSKRRETWRRRLPRRHRRATRQTVFEW